MKFLCFFCLLLSFSVSDFFSLGKVLAKEDKQSLEFRLKSECKKAFRKKKKECDDLKKHERSADEDGFVASCMSDREETYKKCLDKAKGKALSNSSEPKGEEKKEELLKRWTF